MPIDVSADYLIWEGDGTRTITYTSRQSPTSDLAAQVATYTLRRAVSAREVAASNGRYTGSDVNFHVPAGLLPYTAKPGDLITDSDGTDYRVLDASLETLSSRWKCVCRNPVIAYQLYDLINVEEPALTLDASGAAVRTWTETYRQVHCRVQPEEAAVHDSFGTRGQYIRYTVYLSKELVIDAREARVIWKDLTLDVIRYRSSEVLEALPTLEVELRS